LADFYRTYIIDPGKQPLVLMLVVFIVAFAFIRLSTRMIRAQVSWWPGNVTPGGLHIHHVVFGTVLALSAGIGGFTPVGDSSPWRDVFAAVFGLGAALILDEFALILHLKDVYWWEEGRQSVDAVFLGVATLGLIILDASPFGVRHAAHRTALWVVMVVALANLGFVLVTFFKGKLWTGYLGILLPPVAITGAIRLARPASPWARSRYPHDSGRFRRSCSRDLRVHRRAEAAMTWLIDLVGGKPNLSIGSLSDPAEPARAAPVTAPQPEDVTTDQPPSR
jgi:lysyl-tRNA synthetase class 2